MAGIEMFYFRGPGPAMSPEYFVAQVAKLLLNETEEMLTRLADEMYAATGFLSTASRKAILSRVLGDEKKALQFDRLLNVGEAFLQGHGNIEAALSQLAEWQASSEASEGATLSPDELGELRSRLDIVFRSYPARARQAKADRLAAATGLRAESIDLVCDVRPVFDDSRKSVEGLIPFTTLKVVAVGVDKIPVSFEALLSARDVQLLAQKVEYAVAKLNALGRLAEEANLPVPSVDLTETKE